MNQPQMNHPMRYPTRSEEEDMQDEEDYAVFAHGGGYGG